jgi:putative endonuclease
LGAPVVVPAKPPKGGAEPGPMDTELDLITPRQFYVYILTNRRHGTLYIGVTNDLVRRVYEHRTRAVPGFATRYGLDRLVYFEIFNDPIPAIEREKQLKKWRRDWKLALVEDRNPDWHDLFSGIAS